ncbi:MAG TPA: cytochrome C oxidase subunit IV family protein [Isosphaeraceae bacterium]|nr:cytochrome C oxidase subunit IV family protein [Isosphaeraceae bacterium]
MADDKVITKVLAPTEIAEEHDQESHAPYVWVWFWLLCLTVVEYFYAYYLNPWFLILLLGLLVWAGIKASLVAWYFMHLKFEGKWVYFMIVPACVLAAVLVLALTPDVAMKPVEEDVEEAVGIAPAGTADSPGQVRAAGRSNTTQGQTLGA